MPTKKQTTWDCPARTKVKHSILTGYLNAWFPILGTNHGRVVYIDGFAGPGGYNQGEKGSPILAIEVAIAQKAHLNDCEVIFQFIEDKKKRAHNLKEALKGLVMPGNFKYDVEVGTFEEALTTLLDELDESQANNAPVFAFIDPFGFSSVSYNLLRRLMSRDKIEVFVYFARNSINRFLKVDSVKHHMHSLFGLDEIEIPRGVKRIDYLKELYEKQLKKIAKYVGSFTMVNEKGVPNYDLFFATNHPTGYFKMKEAMWRVDKSGGFKYFDTNHPNQSILFQHDPLPKLEKILLSRAKHRKNINIDDIYKYVCEETIYLPTHMKGVLKRLEEAGQIIVHDKKMDGEPRRGKYFAEKTIIDFV